MSDYLSRRFAQLDNYLNTHRYYWQFDAFTLNACYPDFKGNQALVACLQSIDDVALKQYQQDPALLFSLLKQTIPSLLAMDDALFTLENKQKVAAEQLPFWLQTGIKGRKWTQILQFSEHIDNHFPVLEWCAGKGHLGRLVHYKRQTSVHSVEWNAALCTQGQALAKQQQAKQTFSQSNVLNGEADHFLQQQQHAVALHACGDLHAHLITQVKKQQTAKVSISPCCYHLTQQQNYQALSLQASTSELMSSGGISKQDLKLAVAKQSRWNEKQTQLNDQEVWWRLSFDCLQQAKLKTAQYLNVPSFPKTLLSASFKDFVAWVIEAKKLPIEMPADLSQYLALGAQRLHCLRRCELLTQFFSRPLELWLVYDRALSLQEADYDVDIFNFCDSTVSPRNIMIQGSWR